MKTYLTLFFLSFYLLSHGQNFERALAAEKTKNLAYDEKYAVLVGIDTYKDPRIGNLSYSTSDAKAIATLLISELGFNPKNVILLLDSMATRKNIIDTLSRFITDPSISSNSQLVFYYAGHGSTVKNPNDLTSITGFLLTYDSMYDSQYSTAFNMDELKLTAERSQPKHILYLIDVCYGGLAKPRSASSAFIKNVWQMKSREVITAGTGEEKVIESQEWQHSAFTKVFLDAFKNNAADTNGDNIISTAELYGYMQQRVPYYAAMKGGKQTPQYSYFTPDNGTFLFELRSGALNNTTEKSETPLDSEEIAKKFESKLIVTANVNEARVFINKLENKYLSNGRREYFYSPGIYTVEIKKDKYIPISKEIVIKPDTTNFVDFVLEAAFTETQFTIKPLDAAVLIDNNLVGTGTFKTDITKGRHSLIIERKGYKSVNTVINLTQNTSSFDFDLEEIVARVDLVSIPEGALVIENKDTLGKCPQSIIFGAGNHNLLFLKDNFQPKVLSFSVAESGPLRYDILLEESPEFLALKQAKKVRSKHALNFIFTGAFAAGSYLGYNYLNNELKSLDANLNAVPPVKDSREDSRDMYVFGKYSTLALTGIFTLSSTVNLVKIFTTNKKKIMKKNLEEKLKIGIITEPKDNFYALRLKATF